MNIRQADARDALLLSSLSVEVQRLHAENHPDIFKMPKSDEYAVTFFDELLADTSIRIYIAEEAGHGIGYIFCKLYERPESPLTFVNRFLQIEHISVQSAVQHRGVGGALMQRVEELARELRVKKIQLSSWVFNTNAHAFFEKQGFIKFEYRFWKKL